jgi:hypothetical protein
MNSMGFDYNPASESEPRTFACENLLLVCCADIGRCGD